MRAEIASLIPRGGSWPAFRPTAYESDALGQRLLPLARRWQRHRTLQSAPRMLAISFGIALLVVLGAAALGLSRLVIGLALLPVLIPISVLVARALVAPPPLSAALAYDRRLAMFERLSTAVVGSRADEHMRGIQRQDALRALAGVNASLAFPYQVPRGELGVLAIAAAGLAVGLLAVTADILPGVGGQGQVLSLAEDLGTAADATAPVLADPAVLAQIDQIRAAMAELERQRDPEAAPAAVAAQAAGQALRRTAEGRRLGRALDSGDFQTAAGEARELGGQISGMNSTRQDELAAGLREASERAEGLDEGLANQLRAAANALERGQLADARSALAQLAEEIEAVGATVNADRGIEAQLDQLARQLAVAEASAGANTPGADGDSSADSAASAAAAAAQAEVGAAAAAGSQGGGDSVATGRALEGTLETLAPEQRLNVDGQLEIVEIKPTEEGAEVVERPILELGPGGSSGFEASAGDRGYAVGRPDVGRSVPLDMLPMLDRYFSEP